MKKDGILEWVSMNSARQYMQDNLVLSLMNYIKTICIDYVYTIMFYKKRHTRIKR